MSVSLPSIASFHQGAHSVAVVGLGYVGLPLAVAFARHFNVIGFDLNAARVEELSAGTDRTGEVDSEALQASTARFTSDPAALREAGVIIVAVPTPIDEHRNPDLSPVGRGFPDCGAAFVPWRGRRVRVHGLSGRDRRGLRPDP